MLQNLQRLFKGDTRAGQSIELLQSKLDEIEWGQEQSTFPIPETFKRQKESLFVFTDGACRGNPGPGAWASIGQDANEKVLFEISGVDLKTTNNRMELTGVIEGIKAIGQHLGRGKIVIFSDSKYVVDGVNLWVPGWKKRGWKKTDNKVPENVELWQELDQLCMRYRPQFNWVKGHAGHPQNEYCDKLANIALDESGY